MSGAIERLNLPPGSYQCPRFSPDGKQILFDYSQGMSNCWIYGLERGEFRRITQKDYMATWAIWRPDGNGIVYNSK
jgi:Tol biopolymer transport system component